MTLLRSTAIHLTDNRILSWDLSLTNYIFFFFLGIVVNGLINISISTIEKRYLLNSSLTGLISASYDIAFCILSLFVSFFGERGHKPRWLAFSAFMLGLGSLLGCDDLGNRTVKSSCLCLSDTCQIPGTGSANFTCSTSTKSSLPDYLYVFILGQLLLGVGGTPLYTLGTAFIDDSVPKHNTKMDQDDPRWLGAWWIAFLACFFSIWLLIIPFSCFPKHLPGKYLTIIRLLWKRDYLIIASSSEALVATGFATFLPKFIENQFGKTSSFSATLAGLVLIPAAAVGQIISGILVSKYKMDCKSIIKFMISTCSAALLLNTVFLFAKCGNEAFAGVSETYNGTGMLYNLTAPCNANCRCSRSIYYPVCGRDKVQYFSPCFAGCASHLFNNMKKTYHNCSCIQKLERENGSEDFLYEAVSGKCPTQCKFLPLFLTFFFFTVVFTFMAVTPTTVAILRYVFWLKRSNMLLWFLGTIPGPILFGVAIDNSCTLWDINECKTEGACWVYDNERMAYLLMGITCSCDNCCCLLATVKLPVHKLNC
uniref:Kazal-like domain-containing protein n=1 Tax=Athene cunicularia TaxID=194338 RepID=A0A663MTA5_ATHCN